MATELVSNALLHTRSGEPGGWFGMGLRWGCQARIAVHDLGGSTRPPIAPACPPALRGGEVLAEHGRGLQVVRGLAMQIGAEGTPADGHTVWALLALDPAHACDASVRPAL